MYENYFDPVAGLSLSFFVISCIILKFSPHVPCFACHFLPLSVFPPFFCSPPVVYPLIKLRGQHIRRILALLLLTVS